MKKNIIFLLIFATALCSCRLFEEDKRQISPNDLHKYAVMKMGDCFCNDASKISTCLLVDEYIKATPEQRKNDGRFSVLRSKIHNLDDNSYHIDGWMEDIFTNGKSFLEDGDPWKIGLTKTAENVWVNEDCKFIVKEISESNDIVITVQCDKKIEDTEASSPGRSLSSLTSLKNGSVDITNPGYTVVFYDVMTVNFRSGMTLANTIYGTIQVDIMCEGKTIDWVTMSGDGNTVEYKTSR